MRFLLIPHPDPPFPLPTMPAPAVYLLAVIGTVAAGIAFKEVIEANIIDESLN